MTAALHALATTPVIWPAYIAGGAWLLTEASWRWRG